MKAFLVEAKRFTSHPCQPTTMGAAEFSDYGQAVRAADRTFRSGRCLRAVLVRDAEGRVVWGRSVSARFKGGDHVFDR